MTILRIVMAQLNFTVGNIAQNKIKIIRAIREAKNKFNAQLIIFPEMAICGYPPQDLLHRPDFLAQIQSALDEILKEATGIDILLGTPLQINNQLFNSAVWMKNNSIISTYCKQKLPNYGVFDEKRYFEAGDNASIVSLENTKFGVLICEDAWHSEPAMQAKQRGATCLIAINASPFSINKIDQRLAQLQSRTRETNLPIIYVNSIGGQDELIFDGLSFAMNPKGKVIAECPAFEEAMVCVEFDTKEQAFCPAHFFSLTPPHKIQSIYQALVLSTRDYARKNNFSGAILGLSGGIDSALTLAIAVDALGADNITAVMMPSEYTSELSLNLAKEQALNLKINYIILPIESLVNAAMNILSPAFNNIHNNNSNDKTEENIQARVRGLLLMALSNKTGKLVLTTGNKSELAVGYCTLYGDMAGGFCVLKDVFKTQVYTLSHYRNQLDPIIPKGALERAPSAELAPNQKDQDTLPPYDILDDILLKFIEKDLDTQEIIAQGAEANTVNKVISMVLRNEYKRQQSPPGPRITEKAFGKDRRYPIASGYNA